MILLTERRMEKIESCCGLIGQISRRLLVISAWLYLSSNTPQKASHRAKNECNTRVGSLSQSLSVPALIPSGAEEYGESMFLYTCGISIAVTIRSIDPRWG